MKKTPFSSVLAIILCVAMLLGTTYAWFTDSVESGVNQIVAGNLDVELYHQNPQLLAGGFEPQQVTETTELFKNVKLWEPGALALEVLQVRNVGNLALKYRLEINFENETKVEGHGLSEALKIGVLTLEEQKDLMTREAFVKYLTDNNRWKSLASFSESGSLEANKDEQSISTNVYVIYWEPTDQDNYFNMNNANKGKILKIDLGVKLNATQLNSESDSFDNTYDMDATYDDGAVEPVVHVGTAADLKQAIATFTAGKTVVLEKDIDLKNELWDVTAPSSSSGTVVVFDGNGHTIKNLKTNGLYGGLFGKFNSNGDISIKNLTIENVDLVGDNTDGEGSGGALIGWTENHGGTLTIDNVTAKNVNIKDFKYIGGLIGYSSAPQNLLITNCTVNGGEVNSTYNESGDYKGHVGGIIGFFNQGTISGCTVKSLTINGSTTANRAGALIGTAQAGVVIGTGNTVDTVTINGTAVTAAAQVIGSVDNRTDKTTNVTIK